MTAEPTGVVPLRIVKVSVPSLTVPASLLVIVALSVTFLRRALLKVAEALAAAVAVAAALDRQLMRLIGVPEEIGRAVVDGLDDVGAAGCPRPGST